MEKYEVFIKKHIKLNKAELVTFRLRNTLLKFEKGDIIREVESVHDTMYFLESGLVRSYFLNENGKDTSWHFYFNTPDSHETNLFVVDFDSFIHLTKSQLYFEALEPCKIYAIKKSDIELMHTATKKWLRFSLKMSESAYSFVHHKYLMQVAQEAQQRYNWLVETMPYLNEMVPQYHIASYLGITPQHLSRLKKASEHM